jgi:hypothetical protein
MRYMLPAHERTGLALADRLDLRSTLDGLPGRSTGGMDRRTGSPAESHGA